MLLLLSWLQAQAAAGPRSAWAGLCPTRATQMRLTSRMLSAARSSGVWGAASGGQAGLQAGGLALLLP